MHEIKHDDGGFDDGDNQSHDDIGGRPTGHFGEVEEGDQNRQDEQNYKRGKDAVVNGRVDDVMCLDNLLYAVVMAVAMTVP